MPTRSEHGMAQSKPLSRLFLVAEIFIAPCVFYILTIINQYDDRLQAKQRAAKLEKDCDQNLLGRASFFLVMGYVDTLQYGQSHEHTACHGMG